MTKIRRKNLENLHKVLPEDFRKLELNRNANVNLINLYFPLKENS